MLMLMKAATTIPVGQYTVGITSDFSPGNLIHKRKFKEREKRDRERESEMILKC